MDRGGLAPQAKQRPAVFDETFGGKAPPLLVDPDAWPWPVSRNNAALRDEVIERQHLQLLLILSKNARDMLKPDDQRRGQIDAGHHHKPKMSGNRKVGRADRGRTAHWLAEGQSLQPQQQSAESNKQTRRQRQREQRFTGKGGADH